LKKRISVISLGVADLERSRSFYERGLGFVPRPESSERAVYFQLEWSWLSLFTRDRLADLACVSPQGSGFQGFVLSHNVATAAEVDAILKRASDAGATIPRPAEDGSFGRIGYFSDPDGFLWEVAYTPKWPELTA
jgi:predicted lactoylglutathione lyase